MVDDRRDERGEAVSWAERAFLDFIKYPGQGFVQYETGIAVSMSELFDVFGKIAEKENIIITDLARDFNLFREGFQSSYRLQD
jgi:hypothetical protein